MGLFSAHTTHYYLNYKLLESNIFSDGWLTYY